jgi:hypothetical protein
LLVGLRALAQRAFALYSMYHLYARAKPLTSYTCYKVHET